MAILSNSGYYTCQMTPCPPHSVDPYLHLIRHSERIPNDQLEGSKINISLLALATGHHTPNVTERKLWRLYSSPKIEKAHAGLRWAIWRERQFVYSLYSPEGFVAPHKWPKMVARAFKIANPPSPYEVACALLLEPAKDYWSVHAGAPDEIRHAQSITYWWLLGMPLESIAVVLMEGRATRRIERKQWGTDESPILTRGERALVSLEGAMVSFIEHMMKRKRFALWALGSNLVPACSNRHMARVAAIIMSGKTLPKERSQKYILDEAQKKLIEHPYVKAQFRTGKRTNPVDRPIYSPGVLWETLEEKWEWEKGASLGARAMLSHRKTLSKELSPSWFQFPLY